MSEQYGNGRCREKVVTYHAPDGRWLYASIYGWIENHNGSTLCDGVEKVEAKTYAEFMAESGFTRIEPEPEPEPKPMCKCGWCYYSGEWYESDTHEAAGWFCRYCGDKLMCSGRVERRK
jgi:hypothetical protein